MSNPTMAGRQGTNSSPSGFVVTLLTAAGQPAGAGFLAGPGQIVTCAHVVNVALGRDRRSQEMPTQSIRVEFPLLPAAGAPPSSGERPGRTLAGTAARRRGRR